MGHVTDAINTLKTLKTHIIKQTTAAKAAAKIGKFTEAEQLLTDTLQHAVQEQAVSSKQQEGTQRAKGHSKLITLDKLKDEIATLCSEVQTAKAKAAEELQAKTKAAEELQAKTKAAEELQAKTKVAAELQAQTKAAEEPQAQTKAAEEPQAQTKAAAELEAITNAAKSQANSHSARTPLSVFEATIPSMSGHASPAAVPEVEVTPSTTEPLVAPVTNPQSPINIAKESEQERAYKTALAELKTLKTTPPSISIDSAISNLILEVERLKAKGDEDINELTEALKKTHLRLIGDLDHESYEVIAKTMQGHPSTKMMILGGFMVALALAIATVAIVCAPALLGLAGTISTGTIVATGITATVTSIAIAATGFGMFAKGAKQKGLSAAMSHVDKTHLAEPEVQIAPT